MMVSTSLTLKVFGIRNLFGVSFLWGLLGVGHVAEGGLGAPVGGPLNDEGELVGVLSDGLLRPLLPLIYTLGVG